MFLKYSKSTILKRKLQESTSFDRKSFENVSLFVRDGYMLLRFSG